MPEILHNLSAPALINAIETNSFGLADFFRLLPQSEIRDGPTCLQSITNVPYPLFNSILRVRFAADDLATAIDNAIAPYRERNVPALWWTGPATEPANLGDHLAASGLPGGNSPGMAADLHALNEDIPLPTGFALAQLNTPDDRAAWVRIFSNGFDVPDFAAEALGELLELSSHDMQMPLYNYLGWLDGEPVATSSVFLGAGVAGIYNVATLSPARRQGIGAAMTLAPLLMARDMGYRVGILHSSRMGVGVYQRLGFKEYCTIGHHVWLPPADL